MESDHSSMADEDRGETRQAPQLSTSQNLELLNIEYRYQSPVFESSQERARRLAQKRQAVHRLKSRTVRSLQFEQNRMAHTRSMMSPNSNERRLRSARQQVSIARENEPSPLTRRRRLMNQNRSAQLRSREIPDETARRRESNRSHTAQMRRTESTVQSNRRRLTERIRVASSRASTVNAGGASSTVRSITSYSKIALLPPRTVPEVYCGAMDTVCSSCGAKMWLLEKISGSTKANPVFQLCCGKGEVNLPRIETVPEILELLQNPNNRHFSTHIRAYNNALAFTSSGAKFDKDLANGRSGVYTWRVNGNFYHRTSRGLIPADGNEPRFAQIYIYDDDEQIRIRMSMFQELEQGTLYGLQQLLRRINPFVRDCIPNITTLENSDSQEYNLTLRPSTVPTDRRYDIPVASEVAAIIPENENNGLREITFRRRAPDSSANGQILQIIDQNSLLYDPLHYVLLHPLGEPGWTRGLNRRNGARITHQDFYKYRTMVRPGDFEVFHYSNRLAQEYIVDNFCKMQESQLSYIRHNQASLRADVYQGLMDQIVADEGNNFTSGRLIILPPTFVGGERFMKKLFQDAMAIVRRYGKPDLFITFTCNPQWKEITDELYPGQKAANRPDLCSRVFQLKLKQFIDELKKKEVFGKCIASIHQIEFQKRGLPHCHLLMILDEDSKPRTCDDYDSIVCAELPNENTDPVLYGIVTKCLLHGPCGPNYPNAPCMQKDPKRCSKGYPKPFNTETATSTDSYPIYRRRDNGHFFQKTPTSFKYTNQWVVPYNPYLVKRFNAHINTEICATVKATKYLYKYVYKGGDRMQAIIAPSTTNPTHAVIDEIKMYIDGRYVSASEAYWRMYAFSLHSESPSVEALAVHLENQQQVYLADNIPVEEALIAAERQSQTTLTAWFRINQHDSFARTIHYHNFPEYYTWSKSNHAWSRRQTNTKSIGRMHFVSPSDTERYYLRLLLLHRKGLTTFTDARTVDGTECNSYQEAAVRLDLVETNQEYDRDLQDAADLTATSGFQIRELFVSMLLHCNIPDPAALYRTHRDSLIEDFRFHYPEENESFLERRLLTEIERSLQRNGSSLNVFTGLPSVPIFNFVDDEEPDYVDENGEQISLFEDVATRERQFNQHQKEAYTAILSAITTQNSTTNNLFFVDGPGGSGKSYLFTTLFRKVKLLEKKSIIVASSGIAALGFTGGSTAHSKFRIPLSPDPDSTCSITYNSTLANEIRDAAIIIWDEAPMMSSTVFETVDRSLRDIMSEANGNFRTPNTLCFGAKVVVFGGDFRQILPVESKASRARVIALTMKSSYLWRHMKMLSLKRNMRLNNPSDTAWAEFLLRIGEGTEPTDENGYITLPADCIEVADDVALINEMYTNGQSDEIDPLTFSGRAILCPKNEHVDDINAKVVDRMPGCYREYRSIDSVEDGGGNIFPEEYLNAQNFGGLPPHNLRLKNGCIVMVLRNLNKDNGLLNGTRLKITSMYQYMIQGTIITAGEFYGKQVMIPRIKLSPSDALLPFKMTRLQLPIRLAFAMTINRSQCQTLNKVALHFPTDPFTHGQLYVALSRVSTGAEGVVVTSRKQVNTVYKEVFTN